MIYWQTKCGIIQHNIPKGCLLTQVQMRKYKFSFSSELFRKVHLNKDHTYLKDNFRYAINEKEILELPKISEIVKEK